MHVFSYIGPGIGLGGIAIVLVVLALVLVSLGYIIWIPLKNFFRKLFKKK